jgi:hypothetical protein
VVRNFTEREKGNDGRAIEVFSDRPLRLGLEVREEPLPELVLWCDAELIPEFGVTEEDPVLDVPVREERVRARSLAARVEYRWRRCHDRHAVARSGLEGGCRLEDRDSAPLAIPVVTELTPRAHEAFAPAAVDLFEFDRDLYRISADDTVSGWKSTRRWIAPYAWLHIGRRWTLGAILHVEEREIRYQYTTQPGRIVTNDYVVTSASARFAPRPDGHSALEAGWASSHRKRKVCEAGRSITRGIDDHRIFVGYEHVFGPARRLRLVESFELDRGDRGDYGIHDHAFIQLIIGF